MDTSAALNFTVLRFYSLVKSHTTLEQDIYIHTYIHTYLIDHPPLGLFRPNETNNWNKLNRLRIPTGRRQTCWLCTSTAEKLNQGLPGTNPTVHALWSVHSQLSPQHRWKEIQTTKVISFPHITIPPKETNSDLTLFFPFWDHSMHYCNSVMIFFIPLAECLLDIYPHQS